MTDLIRVCGVSENLAAEAARRQSQWVNKRRLKWFVAGRLTGLTVEALTAAYAQAFAAWQAVCGLVFEQTFSQAAADFVVLTRRIDGRNGVLAEHQLPPGNDQQLRGWFDLGENWTVEDPPGGRIYLPAVACHEFGHGIGLGHEQSRSVRALMDPTYNPAVHVPQDWDIAQAVARYGGPVEEPVEPVPGEIPAEFEGMLAILGSQYKVTCVRM